MQLQLKMIIDKLAVSASWLRMFCMLVLVLWCALSLLTYFRVLIDVDSSRSLDGASNLEAGYADAANRTELVDIERLTKLHLFGSPPAAEEKPITESPLSDAELNAVESNLALTLNGIVFTPTDDGATAMIVHNKRQQSYVIGDELPGGDRIYLARVLIDRVIIDNRGRLESLWLYDPDEVNVPVQEAASHSQNRFVSANDQLEERNNASSVSSSINKNAFSATSLSKAVNIAPAYKKGELIGYRITPGKEKQQFQNYGFQPNDIITRINNVELSNPAQLVEVYQEISSASQASVSVQRGNTEIELDIALNAYAN